MKGNALKLGYIRGQEDPLTISPEARATHLYLCGGSGSGKSKLVEYLVRQDIHAWPEHHCGLLLLDPHGSVYHNVVDWLVSGGATALKRPVVLLDPSRDDRVVAYNVLRQRGSSSRSVVVDGLVEAIAHVWGAANTTATPLFARWASNILNLLYVNNLTLAEVAALLDDFPLRQALTESLEEGLALRDWNVAARLNARDFESQVGSTVNRLRAFVENEKLKTMFGQTDVSFDFRQAIDEGWIVLVNLSEEGARVSAADTALLGRLLLSDLWTTVKERGKPRDASQIKPFYVYADEFQTLVTPTLAENLDQARGYGLHLTMSHQFPSQLSDQGPDGSRVLNSIMANVSNKIVFRTAIQKDLQMLAQDLFMGTMDPEQIKLKLYSTKVMGYHDEERQSTTETRSSTRGRGRSSGSGKGHGQTKPIEPPDDLDYEPGSESDQESESTSSNEFDTEGESTSTSTTTVQIAEFGKELSSVQFTSLDEQLFQAMQTLFSQDQRQCVARLAGMKSPVSMQTPTVDTVPHRPKRVEEFITAAEKEWSFVLPAAEAQRRLGHRRAGLLSAMSNGTVGEEPTSARSAKTHKGSA